MQTRPGGEGRSRQPGRSLTLRLNLFLGSRRLRVARADRSPHRFGAFVMTWLLAGTSLTVLAHSGSAQVIGVISLGTFAASGFVLAATLRVDRTARTTTSV